MPPIKHIICDSCKRPVFSPNPIRTPPGNVEVLAVAVCGHCYHADCILEMFKSSKTKNKENEKILFCKHPGCFRKVTEDEVDLACPTLSTIKSESRDSTLKCELRIANARIDKLKQDLLQSMEDSINALKRIDKLEKQLDEYITLYQNAVEGTSKSTVTTTNLLPKSGLRPPPKSATNDASMSNTVKTTYTTSQPLQEFRNIPHTQVSPQISLQQSLMPTNQFNRSTIFPLKPSELNPKQQWPLCNISSVVNESSSVVNTDYTSDVTQFPKPKPIFSSVPTPVFGSLPTPLFSSLPTPIFSSLPAPIFSSLPASMTQLQPKAEQKPQTTAAVIWEPTIKRYKYDGDIFGPSNPSQMSESSNT